MIPHRNPMAFTVPMDDGLYVVVNPLIEDGSKLINQVQLELLNKIDGVTSLEEIALARELSLESAEKIIEVLASKQLVSFDGSFQFPERNNNPRGMNIWVHTTNSCTLACTYCYVHRDMTHMSDEVIKQFTYKLVETARARNLTSIRLRLAGGEPMMRFAMWQPLLESLFVLLEDIGCNLSITFLTNLTILNSDIIAFIKKYRCGVSVSLDGIGCYHDQARVYVNGRGSYTTVMANIETLIAHGVRPYIMTVISNANMNGLPELTQHLVDRKLGFRYSFVKGEDLDQQKLIGIMSECYAIIERALENGYPFSRLHGLCDLSFFRPVLQPCSAGNGNFLMNVDGTMHLCQVALADNKPIGDIFSEDDLLSIMQKQQQYLDLGTSVACKTCQYSYICASGCPLNRVNGKSVFCEVFKELIPMVYRIVGKEKLMRFMKNHEKAQR